jgi:hypothetical protein
MGTDTAWIRPALQNRRRAAPGRAQFQLGSQGGKRSSEVELVLVERFNLDLGPYRRRAE